MDARHPDARFEALVRDYGRLIRHAIRRAARTDAPRLADDIEQTVLVALWQQVAREQVIDHPASYVYRAAVRETVRAVRRYRAQSARAEPAGEEVERVMTTGTTPEDDVRRREQRDALRASLETLAPDRARAVKAHLSGFSVEGWYFAEGATGTFFDLFFLIANPTSQQADVEARYLKPDGTVVVRTYPVPPNSRFNIWVDQEGPALADTAVATVFQVTNNVGVVIERAMWWGGSDGWYEGHNSAGAQAAGTKWGLADGEIDDARGAETYILTGNTSAFAGTARVTLVFEDGRRRRGTSRSRRTAA